MDLLKSKFRIVQSSLRRTGSTLLTNILYGLFIPDCSVCFCDYLYHPDKVLDVSEKLLNNFIIKTHNDDFTELSRVFADYCVYFVTSIRPEKNLMIDEALREQMPNLVIVDYDLLTGDVAVAVRNVVHLLRPKFPKELLAIMDQKAAVNRVCLMNERYNQIKYLGFNEYYDPFYKLHGHHRNRDEEYRSSE